MNQSFQPRKLLGRQARAWLGNAAMRVLAPWVGQAESIGRDVVGILTYHRISPVNTWYGRPTYNVSPHRLRQQLVGLQERGFVAWPLSRVLEHCRSGLAIPRRIFVVTFDDGYANNLTQACDVLKDLGIPATIFLATAYLNSEERFPFDSWKVRGNADQKRDAWIPMTCDQCRAALESGLVELGCHTHTHQDFRHRLVEFQEDLQLSLDLMRREFGIDQPAFSFPFGIADKELRNVARQSRVSCGLTTTPTLVSIGSDPFTWGRFGVSESDSAATLSLKLSGWYDAIRRLSDPGAKSIWSNQNNSDSSYSRFGVQS